jgi:hypothetical protein
MSDYFHFGVKVARALSTKTAAGLGDIGEGVGKIIGRITSSGAKAAPTPKLAPQSVVTAKPSWMRHNAAVQQGLDPATGLKPGAVAPPPPPVPKPALPPRQTPRDNQVGRAFDLLRAGGLRQP